MDGLRIETRSAGGSEWVRSVGEIAEAVGYWVQGNTSLIAVISSAVFIAMITLRLLIRGGFRRSTRL